jgi:ABC-type sugar transport system permease subunit
MLMMEVGTQKATLTKTKEKRMKFKRKGDSSLWWMYLPALAVICFFIVYPFLMGLKISFTNWDGFSQTFEYVGFELCDLASCGKYVDLWDWEYPFSKHIRAALCFIAEPKY